MNKKTIEKIKKTKRTKVRMMKRYDLKVMDLKKMIVDWRLLGDKVKRRYLIIDDAQKKINHASGEAKKFVEIIRINDKKIERIKSEINTLQEKILEKYQIELRRCRMHHE